MERGRGAVRRFALVALASFFLDTLWNLTVVTMTRASWWSVPLSGTMFYVGAFVTISYVKERRLVHAAALGSVLGTAVTVLLLRR
jgi:hypothetical protein